MDYYGIKENVESIRLPEETRSRIIYNVKNRKEHIMKKSYRKPLTVAAALALCLILPLGASAAGKTGFFRDVTNWNDAVIGTTYENATEEISVTAKTENNNILVTVTLLKPEAFPYREIETLSLGSCYLADAAGNRIAELTGTEAVKITSPALTFRLPIEEGAHTLHIEHFVGEKKADQPLPIFGNWVIDLQ